MYQWGSCLARESHANTAGRAAKNAVRRMTLAKHAPVPRNFCLFPDVVHHLFPGPIHTGAHSAQFPADQPVARVFLRNSPPKGAPAILVDLGQQQKNPPLPAKDGTGLILSDFCGSQEKKWDSIIRTGAVHRITGQHDEVGRCSVARKNFCPGFQCQQSQKFSIRRAEHRVGNHIAVRARVRNDDFAGRARVECVGPKVIPFFPTK